MSKTKITKERIVSLIPLVLIFACYVIERAFKRFTSWSETSALIQAIIYTACCAAAYLLIIKSKDKYLGIISAIFAFKIMPPELNMLEHFSADAYLVYYAVRKAALILFAYAVYRLYKEQSKEENAVGLMPVLLLLTAIPFFNPIAASLSNYFYSKTQSMLFVYAVQYACYIIPSVVLMVAALLSGGKGAALIADFSILGLAANLARKAFSATVMANAGMHVSKAFFFWIALYAVFIVCFALIKKKKAV